MENQNILIGQELKPAYYDRFHCLMGDCRLSCCKYQWGVAFDKNDYIRLRNLKNSPGLEERMGKALRRIHSGDLAGKFYGKFDMDGGVCPLLTEEGLCALQAEHGNVLPKVCREFPRAEKYTPAALERSLTPACEGVLALLWDLPEGVDFVLNDLPKPVTRVLHINAPHLPAAFPEIRSLCIDFLQDQALPLSRRILLMGMALRDLADNAEDPGAWLGRTVALLTDPKRAEVCAPLMETGDMELIMAVSHACSVMMRLGYDRGFAALREEVARTMGMSADGEVTLHPEAYRALQGRLEERLAGHETFFENLMVSIFFLLSQPNVESPEALWKSYVNYCGLYNVFRFAAAASCHDPAADGEAARAELFRYLVHTSRALLHNETSRAMVRDDLFDNESATLAHMAILLSI